VKNQGGVVDHAHRVRQVPVGVVIADLQGAAPDDGAVKLLRPCCKDGGGRRFRVNAFEPDRLGP